MRRNKKECCASKKIGVAAPLFSECRGGGGEFSTEVVARNEFGMVGKYLTARKEKMDRKRKRVSQRHVWRSRCVTQQEF